MDPNANLAEQVRVARLIITAADRRSSASRDLALWLAELVEALDEWIRRGGSLPTAWKKLP